ncbi:MAG: KamA family radical SAM protein [Polyangiales bacterium]
MSSTWVSAEALLRRQNSVHSESHRDLLGGEFWRRVPAYRDVDEATFLDHRFQSKASVTKPEQLYSVLRECVSDAFYQAVEEGLARAPMSVRLSPYIISLIDWERPETDPIRRQFLPLASELLPDHPMARLDSLAERACSPVPGLTHRYPDKVLFLTQDRCPVYCRFCTRSYAVGLDTGVRKDHVSAQRERWDRAFEYIRANPQIEDVVISGGDSYSLREDQVRLIGHTLLDIPNIRRMRFATKGLAVLPMKLITDEPWFEALREVAARGRKLRKEVCVHTHFNHPREITEITQNAVGRLFEEGITVRNQTVLLRGVNDDPTTMKTLVRRLGYIGVQPYYVFQHDLVTGVEDLRTSLSASIELEKQMRGATAGFNCPTFVVDTPGGGGKRDVHSYEYYSHVTGVSVFRSPNVDPSARYFYFDPLDQLPEEGQERWANPSEHSRIMEEAVAGMG